MNQSITKMRELSDHSIDSQVVGFFTLLKETLRIPFKNTLFASFIILSSLPFLFLMIYLEILFERTITNIFNFRTFPYSRNLWWPLAYHFPGKILEELIDFPFLPLIYLFLLRVVDLFTAILTIVVSSKLYKDDPIHETIAFKDVVFRQFISIERLKGSFVTCLYVLFLSTCLSFGFILLLLNYYYNYFTNFYYRLFVAVYLPAFLVTLPKYLELNVVWYTSLAVSGLEEVHGIDAFSLSFNLCEGNEKLGRKLMLFFLVCSFGLRMSCLFYNDGLFGVIGRTILLWLAILFKWIVCVMFYHNCKRSKALQSWNDEKQGRLITSIAHFHDTHPHEEAKSTTVQVLDIGSETIGADANIADDKDEELIPKEFQLDV